MVTGPALAGCSSGDPDEIQEQVLFQIREQGQGLQEVPDHGRLYQEETQEKTGEDQEQDQSVVFVGVIYPIIGSWKWGLGFLDAAGFYDFAGSTIVHSVGGWAALAGIIILGPRIGKYVNGKVKDFPGSSVPLATMGVFLLWFGWFGFNGGSVLSANPELVSLVLVNTCLAAACGAMGGYIMGQIIFKRLDLGMVLNGILAGLVGITAGADLMTPYEAMLIGSRRRATP